MPDPTHYRLVVASPTGPVVLDLLAHSAAHAIASAQELSGLGRRATVACCCRLGDWDV